MKLNELKYFFGWKYSRNINPFSSIYAVGRSLIAIGTLTVFIFTDFNFLFDEQALKIIGNSNFLHNKVNLFGLLGYNNLILSKVVSIIILLSVIVGYFPQITGVLHFWVTHSFHSASSILDGGDQIATILTAMLIPISIMDRRKNHWSNPTNQSNLSIIWGKLIFKIISFQVSFIYFNTAVEKLYKLSEWRNGTAMYYVFNGEYFGLRDFLLGLFSPIINSKFVLLFTYWIVFSHLFLSYLLLLERKKNNNLFQLVFYYTEVLRFLWDFGVLVL